MSRSVDCSTDEMQETLQRVMRSVSIPMTPWQQIIHGATAEFRRAVTRAMLRANRYRVAERYQLCGLGDEMAHSDAHGFKVRPVRCGHKLCPRCARYRGSQRVRHVIEHLERGSHGSLWHMVFTQRVEPGEMLSATVARFEKAWRRVARIFGKTGVVAALRSTHCVWSRTGGWHFHAHLFLEIDHAHERPSEAVDHVSETWFKAVKSLQGGHPDSQYARCVAEAGEGLPRDPETQGEFWKDHKDDVARAVQYVVHDVCQGVEAWHLDADPRVAVELVEVLAGMQLSRTYGFWKKTATERFGESEAAEVDGTVEVKSFKEDFVRLGTVDMVIGAAKNGQRASMEAMKWLRDRTSDVSLVGKRLRRALRFLGG